MPQIMVSKPAIYQEVQKLASSKKLVKKFNWGIALLNEETENILY